MTSSREAKGGVIGPIYAAPIDACGSAATSVPWAKPIRIYQFVLITLLFLLTWQTISKETAYEDSEGAFTLALFGAFLLITFVDLISQCGSDPIPDTPMFLFGVFGSIFFVVAAFNMLATSRKDNVTGIVKLLVSMILSFTCAVLFLVDVVLIFLYGY